MRVYILFVANTINTPAKGKYENTVINPAHILEECKKLFNQGDYSSVQKIAQRTLAKDYGNVELRRILAQALMKLKEEQMALMYYEAILSIAPYDADTQGLLADYYTENGPKSRAIELNEQILTYDSGNVHAVESLASLYTSTQKYPQAVKMYQLLADAELDETKLKELEYTLADLYVKIQDDEKAYDTYRKIYQTDTENIELLLILADLAAKNKYWTDCLNYYNKVTAIAGEDFEILEKIVKVQTILEQWSDVIGAYEKLISLEDKQSGNYFYHQNELCKALLDDGQCKLAISKLQDLLIANPKETAFAFTLANAYSMAGEYTLGIELYKKLMDELPPGQADLIVNYISNLISAWAQDLFNKGDYTKVFDKFFEALKYNEENDNVYYRLGVCNFYVKSFQDAVSHFKKAISIKPDSPMYYFSLGCAFDEIGNIRSTKENFANAVNLDSNFVKAQIAYAISMTKEMEYAQSIQQFNEVLKLVPNDADTCYNTAFAYEMIGDVDNAVKNYEKALENNREHKEALNNIRLLAGKDYEPPLITSKTEAKEEENELQDNSFSEDDFDFGENMNSENTDNNSPSGMFN